MAKQFYTAGDIAGILGKSESYGYKVIQQLNKELDQQGYLTARGRVPAQYFYDRFFPERRGK